MINIRKIEEKFYNGDSITNQELYVGLKHFETLTSHLEGLGPQWRLSQNEARRIRDRLIDMKRARVGGSSIR